METIGRISEEIMRDREQREGEREGERHIQETIIAEQFYQCGREKQRDVFRPDLTTMNTIPFCKVDPKIIRYRTYVCLTRSQ